MMDELPTCEGCGEKHHSAEPYCIDCQKPAFDEMMDADRYRGDGR